MSIALTGPFMVQARIAYGLELAHSEIGQNILESAQEIEDEAYDGHDLVSVDVHSDAGFELHHALPISMDLPVPVLTPLLAPSDPQADAYWRGHRKWPPPMPQQRRALLQVFLI